jgi:hypothetical protein
LVGLGLWAVRRALANPSGKDGWLFSYGGTTYSATQPFADWIVKVLPGTPKRSHSFRYATETRLTYAGVAQSKIDSILGHESKTKSAIASGYFGGWKLEQLRDALQTIALPVPALQQN